MKLKLLALAVWLCGNMLAADAALKVYWRRDSETEKKLTGQWHAKGVVALVPTDATAKLAIVDKELRAQLVLPKAGYEEAVNIPLTISLQAADDLVKTNHFKIEMSDRAEDLIKAYLKNRRSKDERELEVGHRFEPVIAVRGFTLNKTETTAAVIVPTYLELAFDDKATDTEDDSIVFRGIYVPEEISDLLTNLGLWKTDPVIDTSFEKCQISYDVQSNRLRFHFLDRARLAYEIQKTSMAGKGIDFIFGQTVTAGTEQPNTSAEVNSPAARANAWVRQRTVADSTNKLVKTPVPVGKRPVQAVYTGRNLRFSSQAPASNWEMPLLLKGGYTHTADSKGKTKDVANLEVDFNMSDKLWAPLNFLSLTPNLSIAPVLNAKVNTTGIVNDENSIRTQIPLAFHWFPRACCTKGSVEGDTFHLPFLRRASTFVGFQGEAGRITSKRTYGGFLEERFFFSRVKAPDSAFSSFKVEPILGWEAGRYREEQKNTFVQATDQGVVKGPDGNPVSATSVVTRNDTYNRLHGGIHSTLTLGPVISVTTSYDMWRLLKEESFFDSTGSAAGAFTPYPGQTLPTNFTTVDSSVAFIASGRLLKGTRRYLDVVTAFQLNKFFDLNLEYARGELPPVFQFVNKVQVSLSFKIIGKDSLIGR